MYEEVDSRSVFVSRSSAAASSYAALPETVRIGTDTTYAPFSSKDAKGDFVGFDIDLGNEMCKRMQVKCTWLPATLTR